MIDTGAVREFLAVSRIAVVGASEDNGNFGTAIYKALRDHGYETYAVNPSSRTAAGDTCYAELADVPAALEGVIIVVNPERAVRVVDTCVMLGIPRVWLFKGLGGAGAVSDEAVERCTSNGIEVIAGACPFMFLEPVGWFHKLHRVAQSVTRVMPPKAA